MEFLVLGSVEVVRDGERKPVDEPQQRSLLALLVADAGHPVAVDRLVSALAGSGSEQSLRQAAARLDARLDGAVKATDGGYVLDVDPGSIDAVRFERAVFEAGNLLPSDPAAAGVMVRSALEMWRGRPYADVDPQEPLLPEIDRLRQRRLDALEIRIDADLATGHHNRVVDELEALTRQHPRRERFRAQLMVALYRAGHRERAVDVLRHSPDPSPALHELGDRIGRDDEELLQPSHASTRRLAFLVTDIEGSTRKWDRHPDAMATALADHDEILTHAVADAGGTVVKHTGDGILAVFPSAPAAVRAAEAAQHRLDDHDWGTVGELKVRMGIDVGEAELRDGDYHGTPLNRAARLTAAGHGGQVLASSAVQRELAGALPPGIQLRPLGEHTLRGLPSGEAITQIVFIGLPADFPDLRLDAFAEPGDAGPGPSLPGYEVRDLIGTGAFGVVYRAYQPSVGREVAIKVIRPDLASLPSFVRRFEAEARTIARLAHPRIVPLHDFWRDADGAYLVMQLLTGGNLADALASATVDPTSGVRHIRHIAEALVHAHDRGVVHGDLKPANVLLDGSGNAYLSDFGIAGRLLDPAEVGIRPSSAPAYRAPEEATGGGTRSGDVYALGVLAFETLTGRSPAPAVALPPASEVREGLPAALDAILARATAIDPADRYATVGSFLEGFSEATTDLAEGTVAAALVARNPYKGLRAFDEADAGDFHGRRELVASLLAAVERHRFVTVTGPSGCGKSSAVRAGLIPELRRGAIRGSEDWFFAVFAPSHRPLDALVDALESVATNPVDVERLIASGDLTAAVDGGLAGAEGDLLLVVDQFEEAFTLVDDPERRGEFLDVLVAGVAAPGTRLRVVATLRADFYDRPLSHDGLDRLVRDGLVTVLLPTRDELAEMITKPAHDVGLRWEPGLSHRIAQEVHGQTGGLPLLQYALTEMVEHRSSGVLTGDDYEELGGVTGALAARAEAVCSGMTASQQSAARQVLLRLVTVGEDTDDTRRRVQRSELESLGLDAADLETVLDALVTRRLLTTDRDPITHEPTVEVAHEALLEKWPRLRGWIEDQRESLILGRRLRAAIDEWEGSGRNDGYLLTGERLAPFRGWLITASLTNEERSYLDASIAREEAAAASRVRRRRVLTGVLGAAAIVAVALAVFASLQWVRADRAAAEQLRLANEARARELVAAANAVVDDPELGLLLALQAVDATGGGDPVPAAVDLLHRAVVSSPVRERHDADLAEADPAGNYLLMGSIDITELRDLTLWDRSAGAGTPIPGGQAGDPAHRAVSAALSEDGRLVAFGLADGDVAVRDTGTFGEVFSTKGIEGGHERPVETIVFQPGGALLASAGSDGIRVWDLRTGLVTSIEGFPLGGLAFSGDGTLLAAGWLDVQGVGRGEATAVVWEAATGQERYRLPDVGRTVTGVAFGPDGGYLAVSYNDGEVGLGIWDLASGTESVNSDTTWNEAVAVNRDGTLIAAGGDLLRSTGFGFEFVQHLTPARPSSLAFDGADMLIGTLDTGGIVVWDLSPAGFSELLTVTASVADPNAIAFSNAGSWIGAGDGDRYRIIDAYSGDDFHVLHPASELVGRFRPAADPAGYRVVDAAFSPDDTLLATAVDHTGDLGGGVILWDTGTGEVVQILGDPDRYEGAWSVSFSPDGSLLAASVGNGVTVWDTSGFREIFTVEPTAALWWPSVAFHPDGTRIAARAEGIEDYLANYGNHVAVLDAEGREMSKCCEHAPPQGDASRVEFSPDGSVILTNGKLSGSSFEAGLWDPAGGGRIGTLGPVDGLMLAADFGPDGRLVALGDAGTVRIFEAATGVLRLTLPGLPGDPTVTDLDFGPDGSRLAVAYETGGAVRVFALDVHELRRIAVDRLTRTFDQSECDTYNVDPCPTLEEIRATIG